MSVHGTLQPVAPGVNPAEDQLPEIRGSGFDSSRAARRSSRGCWAESCSPSHCRLTAIWQALLTICSNAVDAGTMSGVEDGLAGQHLGPRGAAPRERVRRNRKRRRSTCRRPPGRSPGRRRSSARCRARCRRRRCSGCRAPEHRAVCTQKRHATAEAPASNASGIFVPICFPYRATSCNVAFSVAPAGRIDEHRVVAGRRQRRNVVARRRCRCAMSAVPNVEPPAVLMDAIALPGAPAIATPDQESRSVCPAVPANVRRALRPGRSRLSASAEPPTIKRADADPTTASR